MEEAIAAGRVLVNGEAATEGMRVRGSDFVQLDKRSVLSLPDKARLLLYHKPTGKAVSRSEREAPSVFYDLPPVKGRWVNVGRLDIDSEGLLLFTNDGDLANFLAHPRNEFEREYRARVDGELSQGEIEMMLAGEVGDSARPAARGANTATTIRSLRSRRKSSPWRPSRKAAKAAITGIELSCAKGANRLVRRVFAAYRLRVNRLLRVRHGPFELPRDLPLGAFVEADPQQLLEIRLRRDSELEAANQEANQDASSDANQEVNPDASPDENPDSISDANPENPENPDSISSANPETSENPDSIPDASPDAESDTESDAESDTDSDTESDENPDSKAALARAAAAVYDCPAPRFGGANYPTTSWSE